MRRPYRTAARIPTSTGALSGRDATPTAARAGRPASPKSSTSRSLNSVRDLVLSNESDGRGHEHADPPDDARHPVEGAQGRGQGAHGLQGRPSGQVPRLVERNVPVDEARPSAPGRVRTI